MQLIHQKPVKLTKSANWSLLTIFLTLSLVSISLSSHSAETETEITIVTEVFEPFQFLDDQSKPIGYGIDVANALLSRVDLTPKFEFYPWLRTYKKAINHQNTLILTIARTPQRENQFHWIGLLNREVFSFYALKGNDKIKPINSLEDVKRYSVVVTKDSFLDDYVTSRNFPLVERSIDLGQTYKMLFRGRSDLILKSRSGVKLQTRDLEYDYDALVDVFEIPEFYSDFYIAININSDPELVKRLQTEFNWLNDNGVIQDLKDRWNF